MEVEVGVQRRAEAVEEGDGAELAVGTGDRDRMTPNSVAPVTHAAFGSGYESLCGSWAVIAAAPGCG